MPLSLAEILPREGAKALEDYLEALLESIDLFRKSLRMLDEVRVGDARSTLAEIVKVRTRAGRSKMELLKVIDNLRLDPGMKEDLLHFVKRLDAIGDNIKEAARELTIMPYLEVPSPIRSGLAKLADLVFGAATHVVEATRLAMAGDHERALALIEKVIEEEEEADRQDVQNRGMLIAYSDAIKPPTLAIIIHDFNRDLENAADACADAADYLHILITVWLQMERVV